MKINYVKNQTPKEKPIGKLGFGQYFTDHMFIMDYNIQDGWNNPRIVPYGNIELSPAAMVLHYGQELFEGMKAYKNAEGKVRLFRPDKNVERMNMTCDRLCVPRVNVADALEAIMETVRFDAEWIPEEDGTSLYIRPFIFATDPFIGVRPSNTYMFMIILSPVGSYYPNGIDPVKIYVESEYVRAVKGGIGFVKAGGNYCSSLKSQDKAYKLGYTQVLWLDGVERKYIDEVGTMNVFFIIDNKVITPALEGSILPGVTRASCIELLKSWGYTLEERRLSIDEVMAAGKDGSLNEAFGTGTAAVISPIGELNNNGDIVIINNNKIGSVAQKLYDTITGIQYGRVKDEFGWSVEL